MKQYRTNWIWLEVTHTETLKFFKILITYICGLLEMSRCPLQNSSHFSFYFLLGVILSPTRVTPVWHDAQIQRTVCLSSFTYFNLETETVRLQLNSTCHPSRNKCRPCLFMIWNQPKLLSDQPPASFAMRVHVAGACAVLRYCATPTRARHVSRDLKKSVFVTAVRQTEKHELNNTVGNLEDCCYH